MKLTILALISLLIILFIGVCAIALIFKYVQLSVKYSRLSKYLYNFVNTITSARYGNLNSTIEDGVDALTIQMSRNTNALLESIKDRDSMINEYIEKEKQSQSLKQDFISSLAHDLKVPIIAQDNTYDLLLNGNFGEINDTQKDVIKNLKVSNNDLKNLIIDLLDAHKLDKQELKPELENIDIVKLIQEVISQNQSILTIQNKKINFNSQFDEVFCLADSFLIKRVLTNLISNAIFYSKNSENIYINLNKHKKNIEISIIDEGKGIKEEEIKKIFKKYYSSTKKYSNIGIGLGLYIANKIMLSHGGKIVAKNNEGKGACFTVVLPDRIK